MATKPVGIALLFPNARALTSEQRSHIFRRLIEERARVTYRLTHSAAQSVANAQANHVSPHVASVGTDTVQGSLSAAFASPNMRTLSDIDDALRRFDRDPTSFGVDERTGIPIAFERLDLIPWTRRA